MNLKRFVNKESHIREAFNDTYPNQGARAGGDLKAPSKTNHPAIVGMAFDYLVRFYLEHHNPDTSTRTWTAEASLQTIQQHYPDKLDAAEAALDRADEVQSRFLQTGDLTRDVIEVAIDLARVEQVFRSGRPESLNYLGEYDEADVDDCRRLFEVLAETNELDGERFDLNPSFGLASAMLASDADLIVDNTLVDLKATKTRTFKAAYWRQLVGYCLLADIHNILVDHGWDEGRLPEILKFGVYFARHGELNTVPAEAVYGADGYEEFRAWFVDTALSYENRLNDAQEAIFREIFCDPYDYSEQ